MRWLFSSIFGSADHPLYWVAFLFPVEVCSSVLRVSHRLRLSGNGLTLLYFGFYLDSLWAFLPPPTCALSVFGYGFVCFVSVAWNHVNLTLSFDDYGKVLFVSRFKYAAVCDHCLCLFLFVVSWYRPVLRLFWFFLFCYLVGWSSLLECCSAGQSFEIQLLCSVTKVYHISVDAHLDGLDRN